MEKINKVYAKNDLKKLENFLYIQAPIMKRNYNRNDIFTVLEKTQEEVLDATLDDDQFFKKYLHNLHNDKYTTTEYSSKHRFKNNKKKS